MTNRIIDPEATNTIWTLSILKRLDLKCQEQSCCHEIKKVAGYTTYIPSQPQIKVM
jgi:hypothetical protein